MLISCSEQSQEPPTPERPPIVDAAPDVPRVPFVMDDLFHPSGCMGDCETPPSLVSTVAGECPEDRAPTAQGNCYRFVYSPATPESRAIKGWAGVLWQWPTGNWGAAPGRLIAPGATRVSFLARGEQGGEVVLFQVGGIQDSELAYRDTIKDSLEITLTSSYERYTIPVTSAYEYVLGGFGWVIERVPTNGPIIFYVDDIRWE